MLLLFKTIHNHLLVIYNNLNSPGMNIINVNISYFW